MCVVKGVEVCVETRLDPKELCDCIVTETDFKTRKEMDWDLDFVHDKCDNCQRVENEDQKDRDFDGVGDLCNNCVNKANRDQRDSDIGNECEDQDDGNSQEEEETDNNKNLATAIMQKLMEWYYSK